MSKFKNFFKHFFSKKRVFWAIGLAVGVFIFISSFSIWLEYREQKEIYRTRDEKQTLLGKLSTEVQLSYFNNLLGEPVYKDFPDDDLISYTYVDPEYYVWVLTNKDEKVRAYSITSRDLEFQPGFDFNGKEIVLNKTPFSEWTETSLRECYRFLGAHDPIYYFESTYGANPGKYQTYWVGINNAAPHEDLPFLEVKSEEDDVLGFVSCDLVKERSESTFNTIMVWAPFFSVSDEALERDPMRYFGPDNIQTRTLNE